MRKIPRLAVYQHKDGDKRGFPDDLQQVWDLSITALEGHKTAPERPLGQLTMTQNLGQNTSGIGP